MTDIPSRLAAALRDRYRVERPLGAGGMATVYLADDLRHQRRVAIKVLKPELAAVVGADRFLAEIETTANLQHPHILPLFDSGEADGFLFYVMPYVEGESLRDRLDREQQLPVDEAIRIAGDVAEALYAAHQRGVIHRDIKPANILLSGGRPLVADFGIALAVSNAGGGRLTETGLSMGTPYYMSPEQASADRDPTPASDQYSLACVLYEMLVGEPPFPGGSAQAVLARILTGEPEPPSAMRKSVPPHVDAVVMRGLEKLPADRFPDAREMVRALRDEGHRYATGARRPVAGPGRRPWATVLPWGMSAALALAAVAGWVGRDGGGGALDSLRLAVPFPEDSPLPLGPLTALGLDAGLFDVSADGRTMVHLGWDGEGVSLYRRSLDSYESVRLEGTEGALSPFFSPDGQWIAYFAETGLWKVPLEGGEPVRIANASNPTGGFWGSDDRIWFSSLEGGRLSSVPSTGGEARPESSGGSFRYPVPLPGSRGILGSSSEPENILLRTPAGEFRQVTPGVQPRILPSGYLTFVRGRTLYAAGLDLERGSLTTPPVPMIEGVRSQGDAAAYNLSPDGTLFYVPGANADVGVPVLVNPDGGTDTLAMAPAQYGHLALSPDQDRIATYEMSSEYTLSIHDVGSSRAQLVDRAYRMLQAQWSRAGDRIAYSRQRAADGPWEIVVRIPGSTREDVVVTSPWVLLVSDWFPDDGQLLYSEWTSELGAQIYRATVTGDSEPALVVGSGAEEWGATLSPDGRWLAYTSDRGGTYEVYVVPFPLPEGGGAIKVSAHPNAEEPHWSFDGNALLYRASGEWWRVPLTFVPDPVPGTPELLVRGSFINVSGKSWDLLPDGRLLLFEGPRETTADRIHMIPDFTAEIERRVAGVG